MSVALNKSNASLFPEFIHDRKINSAPSAVLLFRKEVRFIFVAFFFATHLTASWFCTASTVQHPCFHFFSAHDIFLRFVCAPTLMQVCFDTFPRQIIKSSSASNNTIMFMCVCVFCCARHLQKELKVEPVTALTPMLRLCVCSDWIRRLICISNQIIALIPIRSITSGEHEDITTPT